MDDENCPLHAPGSQHCEARRSNLPGELKSSDENVFWPLCGTCLCHLRFDSLVCPTCKTAWDGTEACAESIRLIRRLPATVAAPLIGEILVREPLGCCLHLVTEDGNLDRSSVVLGLERAIALGHVNCRAAAGLLLRMGVTARKKAVRLAKESKEAT